MSRWKAAAIHLSISAAVGLAAALLIFGLWYPPPYSRATGALGLIMLLLGVDIVLGPLLTLVVFKSGKKSLKLDLSIIATLQAAAFLYGMSVVTAARPVYIVSAVDRFVIVAANQLEDDDLAEAPPEFRRLPWTGPRIIGSELPSDSEERTDLLFSALAGKDVEHQPRYYRPYETAAPALLQRAKPLEDLYRINPQARTPLEAWLRKHGHTAEAVRWLPIKAREDATMLIDATTATPLGAVDVAPW